MVIENAFISKNLLLKISFFFLSFDDVVIWQMVPQSMSQKSVFDEWSVGPFWRRSLWTVPKFEAENKGKILIFNFFKHFIFQMN